MEQQHSSWLVVGLYGKSLLRPFQGGCTSDVTDPGIGIQRSDSLGLFLREKENPDLEGKDSNLCCQVKSTQSCLEFRKFGRLLAQFLSLQFLVLFCAFICLAWIEATITDIFCGILGFRSERSGSDSNPFFRKGWKIRKSRSLKSGIRNNTKSEVQLAPLLIHLISWFTWLFILIADLVNLAPDCSGGPQIKIEANLINYAIWNV
jgi:hypothetical protein